MDGETRERPEPANAGEMQARDPGGRFTPGRSGNPRGKRRGTLNRTTRVLQKLLAGEAEALTRAAIDKGLAGDVAALKLCLDRILPHGRMVQLDVPQITSAADATRALAAVIEAAGRGQLTPAEAQSFCNLVEGYVRAYEVVELEERVRSLEDRTRGKVFDE